MNVIQDICYVLIQISHDINYHCSYNHHNSDPFSLYTEAQLRAEGFDEETIAHNRLDLKDQVR